MTNTKAKAEAAALLEAEAAELLEALKHELRANQIAKLNTLLDANISATPNNEGIYEALDPNDNSIAQYRYVDYYDDLYEGLSEEDQADYDKRDEAISINDALKGEGVDWLLYMTEEELQQSITLSVAWSMVDYLHYIGIDDPNDLYDLVEAGKLKATELARDGYGSYWKLTYDGEKPQPKTPFSDIIASL